MANTSSAKKAVGSSEKKKIINDTTRENYKAAVKAVRKAVEEKVNDKELAKLISAAYKAVDKAAKKTVNIISKNKAARVKSSLTKAKKA